MGWSFRRRKQQPSETPTHGAADSHTEEVKGDASEATGSSESSPPVKPSLTNATTAPTTSEKKAGSSTATASKDSSESAPKKKKGSRIRRWLNSWSERRRKRRQERIAQYNEEAETAVSQCLRWFGLRNDTITLDPETLTRKDDDPQERVDHQNAKYNREQAALKAETNKKAMARVEERFARRRGVSQNDVACARAFVSKELAIDAVKAYTAISDKFQRKKDDSPVQVSFLGKAIAEGCPCLPQPPLTSLLNSMSSSNQDEFVEKQKDTSCFFTANKPFLWWSYIVVPIAAVAMVLGGLLTVLTFMVGYLIDKANQINYWHKCKEQVRREDHEADRTNKDPFKSRPLPIPFVPLLQIVFFPFYAVYLLFKSSWKIVAEHLQSKREMRPVYEKRAQVITDKLSKLTSEAGLNKDVWLSVNQFEQTPSRWYYLLSYLTGRFTSKQDSLDQFYGRSDTMPGQESTADIKLTMKRWIATSWWAYTSIWIHCKIFKNKTYLGVDFEDLHLFRKEFRRVLSIRRALVRGGVTGLQRHTRSEWRRYPILKNLKYFPPLLMMAWPICYFLNWYYSGTVSTDRSDQETSLTNGVVDAVNDATKLVNQDEAAVRSSHYVLEKKEASFIQGSLASVIIWSNRMGERPYDKVRRAFYQLSVQLWSHEPSLMLAECFDTRLAGKTGTPLLSSQLKTDLQQQALIEPILNQMLQSRGDVDTSKILWDAVRQSFRDSPLQSLAMLAKYQDQLNKGGNAYTMGDRIFIKLSITRIQANLVQMIEYLDDLLLNIAQAEKLQGKLELKFGEEQYTGEDLLKIRSLLMTSVQNESKDWSNEDQDSSDKINSESADKFLTCLNESVLAREPSDNEHHAYRSVKLHYINSQNEVAEGQINFRIPSETICLSKEPVRIIDNVMRSELGDILMRMTNPIKTVHGAILENGDTDHLKSALWVVGSIIPEQIKNDPVKMKAFFEQRHQSPEAQKAWEDQLASTIKTDQDIRTSLTNINAANQSDIVTMCNEAVVYLYVKALQQSGSYHTDPCTENLGWAIRPGQSPCWGALPVLLIDLLGVIEKDCQDVFGPKDISKKNIVLSKMRSKIAMIVKILLRLESVEDRQISSAARVFKQLLLLDNAAIAELNDEKLKGLECLLPPHYVAGISKENRLEKIKLIVNAVITISYNEELHPPSMLLSAVQALSDQVTTVRDRLLSKCLLAENGNQVVRDIQNLLSQFLLNVDIASRLRGLGIEITNESGVLGDQAYGLFIQEFITTTQSSEPALEQIVNLIDRSDRSIPKDLITELLHRACADKVFVAKVVAAIKQLVRDDEEKISQLHKLWGVLELLSLTEQYTNTLGQLGMVPQAGMGHSNKCSAVPMTLELMNKYVQEQINTLSKQGRLTDSIAGPLPSLMTTMIQVAHARDEDSLTSDINTQVIATCSASYRRVSKWLSQGARDENTSYLLWADAVSACDNNAHLSVRRVVLDYLRASDKVRVGSRRWLRNVLEKFSIQVVYLGTQRAEDELLIPGEPVNFTRIPLEEAPDKKQKLEKQTRILNYIHTMISNNKVLKASAYRLNEQHSIDTIRRKLVDLVKDKPNLILHPWVISMSDWVMSEGVGEDFSEDYRSIVKAAFRAVNETASQGYYSMGVITGSRMLTLDGASRTTKMDAASILLDEYQLYLKELWYNSDKQSEWGGINFWATHAGCQEVQEIYNSLTGNKLVQSDVLKLSALILSSFSQSPTAFYSESKNGSIYGERVWFNETNAEVLSLMRSLYHLSNDLNKLALPQRAMLKHFSAQISAQMSLGKKMNFIALLLSYPRDFMTSVVDFKPSNGAKLPGLLSEIADNHSSSLRGDGLLQQLDSLGGDFNRMLLEFLEVGLSNEWKEVGLIKGCTFKARSAWHELRLFVQAVRTFNQSSHLLLCRDAIGRVKDDIGEVSTQSEVLSWLNSYLEEGMSDSPSLADIMQLPALSTEQHTSISACVVDLLNSLRGDNRLDEATSNQALLVLEVLNQFKPDQKTDMLIQSVILAVVEKLITGEATKAHDYIMHYLSNSHQVCSALSRLKKGSYVQLAGEESVSEESVSVSSHSVFEQLRVIKNELTDILQHQDDLSTMMSETWPILGEDQRIRSTNDLLRLFCILLPLVNSESNLIHGGEALVSTLFKQVVHLIGHAYGVVGQAFGDFIEELGKNYRLSSTSQSLVAEALHETVQLIQKKVHASQTQHQQPEGEGMFGQHYVKIAEMLVLSSQITKVEKPYQASEFWLASWFSRATMARVGHNISDDLSMAAPLLQLVKLASERDKFNVVSSDVNSQGMSTLESHWQGLLEEWCPLKESNSFSLRPLHSQIVLLYYLVKNTEQDHVSHALFVRMSLMMLAHTFAYGKGGYVENLPHDKVYFKEGMNDHARFGVLPSSDYKNSEDLFKAMSASGNKSASFVVLSNVLTVMACPKELFDSTKIPARLSLVALLGGTECAPHFDHNMIAEVLNASLDKAEGYQLSANRNLLGILSIVGQPSDKYTKLVARVKLKVVNARLIREAAAASKQVNVDKQNATLLVLRGYIDRWHSFSKKQIKQMKVDYLANHLLVLRDVFDFSAPVSQYPDLKNMFSQMLTLLPNRHDFQNEDKANMKETPQQLAEPLQEFSKSLSDKTEHLQSDSYLCHMLACSIAFLTKRDEKHVNLEIELAPSVQEIIKPYMDQGTNGSAHVDRAQLIERMLTRVMAIESKSKQSQYSEDQKSLALVHYQEIFDQIAAMGDADLMAYLETNFCRENDAFTDRQVRMVPVAPSTAGVFASPPKRHEQPSNPTNEDESVALSVPPAQKAKSPAGRIASALKKKVGLGTMRVWGNADKQRSQKNTGTITDEVESTPEGVARP